MNSGKYVFAQLIEFLTQKVFQRIVMINVSTKTASNIN